MSCVGDASTHNELVALLRRRKEALGLSDLALDHRAGLASGHSGKILGPLPVRTLGEKSLTGLLRALGVKLVMVEDPKAKLTDDRRVEKYVTAHETVSRELLKRARPIVLEGLARKGAAARWARSTPDERAAVVAKMNEARAAKRRPHRAGTSEAAVTL